jgi:hypothetical protein
MLALGLDIKSERHKTVGDKGSAFIRRSAG